MITDPIADLLTRIRNASRKRHESTIVPYSKLKENILKVLKEKEFVEDIAISEEGKFKEIKITLKRDKTDINLKRISKPGRRVYAKNDNLSKIRSGLGTGIISTSKGIMTTEDARKQNLGGEIICEVY